MPPCGAKAAADVDWDGTAPAPAARLGGWARWRSRGKYWECVGGALSEYGAVQGSPAGSMRLDPRVRIAVSLSLEGDPSLKRDKRPAQAQIKGGSKGTGQRVTVKRRRQGNTVERCRRCGWTCHTHTVYPLPQKWSRSRTVFVAALGAASSRKARSRPPHPGPLRSLLVDPLRARQAEPALPSQVLRAARPRLAGAKRTPVPIQRRQSRVPSFSASSSSSSPGLNLVSAGPSPSRDLWRE